MNSMIALTTLYSNPTNDALTSIGGIMIFVGIAVNIALCFAVATLFNRKGHSYAGGFWLSFFLSPLVGLIWGACISDVSNIRN